MEELKIKVNPTYHEETSRDNWEKNRDKRYLEYREKWFNNPRQFIVENAPIHLDIEVTSACNLSCPMCDSTIEKNKGDNCAFKLGHMTMDLYRKLIDEACNIGIYSIKLNWRGEPLIHPSIIEMVKYAKEKGIIDIMMNTNGVCLNEKMCRDLIEAGIDHIFVSIDSIKKDRYEKYRAGAKFDSVMENIRTLKRINEEYGHPVETRVSKVRLYETEDEEEEYINVFKTLVDRVAYIDYAPYGDGDLGKPVDMSNEDLKYSCSELWLRLFVSWDGKYFMCCDDHYEEVILGYADKQSISEIWNGKQLQEYRELHKAGQWRCIEKCSKCFTPYM